MGGNTIVVAVKGVILHKGKVLIVKRALDDYRGGTWECPGGKIDFGEDLEVALIREIEEEVGLAVTVDKILFATTFNTEPTRQVVILTYLCRSESQTVVLSEEHSEYLWAMKEQLKEMLVPEIVADFEKNEVLDLEGLL
ncbi:NUDIX domain-containing protein [Robertmurraya yapensis]|uniref:8-oxo-dGTP diphosphatase n=1 Tax=Bacillus yapensis TaxID=2492960 RepID=A0A3S0K2B2_9BACI|nr:NUDIX domain-containing protein [Bacillus yapensis]TKS97427.1 NUDIX domain-containing protein [Bacillus yapensis]